MSKSRNNVYVLAAYTHTALGFSSETQQHNYMKSLNIHFKR